MLGIEILFALSYKFCDELCFNVCFDCYNIFCI